MKSRLEQKLRASQAISPGAISSFFEICNTDAAGRPLEDPARIGSRGGGFAIKRGVQASVITRRAIKNRIRIRINSRMAPEARTTQWALMKLIEEFKKKLQVNVDITTNVPISAGYGTSAAGTAASCLALADALQLPVTVNELGRITHIAEVVNGTGLGTASAVFIGGFDLVTEPGAPGIGSVDRLLFPKGHSIICAYLGPMLTHKALSMKGLMTRVNPLAQRAMKSIRALPELSNFLGEAKRFCEESPFHTPQTRRVIDIMIGNGATGAAQNMIGQAVHGVAKDDRAWSVASSVRKAFPSARVFVTKLDNRGARLEEKPKPKH